MVAVTSRWRAKLPDIGAAASRFPLAVLIAATFTLFKLYHDYVGDAETRTLAALAASFLWAVAVDFYVESTAQPRSLRVLLWLAGNAVIALLFWLAWDLWLNQYLFLAGLLLLLAVAGQLGRSERNGSFWLFNHRLWLGAALALIAAVLFGAGLSIIVETLQLLFGLELPSRSHDYIWTVSLGFVAPVSFLAFAPRAFYDPITEREESDFTMRAVSALVTFVLVPLLLVYTAILFAYAAKIAFEASLPKGTLGSMVAGYLLVCVATLLLAYPIREKGSVLVRLFWRYWAWLAALPVLLLFLAVYRRIADYGVTEQRYVMVLIGVWILVLAAIRLWQGGNFDLRIVPGLLALFLLAASFGPGGAVGFSVMSQTGELQQILAAKDMLVDGRFIARKADENSDPPLGRSGARARSIVWYLNEHRSLGLLAPSFEDASPNPFAEGKTPEMTEREVILALGLRPDLSRTPGIAHFTHYSDVPVAVVTTGANYVLGPIVFQHLGPVPAPIPSQSVAVEGLGNVELDLADNLLTARVGTGDALNFNIVDAVKEIYRRGWPRTSDQRPVSLKGAGGGLTGTLLIDNLNGAYEEPNFDLTLLRFWLVLNKAP